MTPRVRLRLFVLALLPLAGCTGTPAPIEYGRDGCDYCRMEIADQRYGTQLITSTGKVHAFDSIECLASFAETLPSDRIREILVSDFANPGRMLRVESARFYRDSRRSGPMGGGLLAIGGSVDSAWVAINVRGAPLTWDELQTLAASGELQQLDSLHLSASGG